MTERAILDTDIGDDIDDLYALALALSLPELEVLGVTTVFKVSQARARVAAKFLRLAGRSGIPVRAGIDWPPARRERGESNPASSDHTHWVTKSDPEFKVEFEPAVPWILQQLEQAREPITLVAIGPLSNIAAALEQATPKQRSAIKRIAIMGGECALLRREYNVACDPEAASAVLSSGLPVFQGTWSVTRQLQFTMDEVDRMFAGDEAPTHKALLDTTRLWMPAQTTKQGPVLYDLVPLFHLIDPSLVETRRMNVTVELADPQARGLTTSREAPDATVDVSQSMSAETMRRRFLKALGLRAP